MFPQAIVDALSAALLSAAAADDLPDLGAIDIEVERPRDAGHGDWATNLALAAAGRAGAPPRRVAEAVLAHLPPIEHLEAADIAGPGFLNFTLAPTALHEVLRRAARGGIDHARSDIGGGQRVQVEFVSANPNGPIHIGHGRGGIFGDALCNLLDYCGYRTEREYYFNDSGAQMDLYGASLEARYFQELGDEAPVPEGGYQGLYVVDWSRELIAEKGDGLRDLPPDERSAKVQAWGLERAMRDIRETLDLAGIRFDVWFSERTLYERGDVARALGVLEDRGFVYESQGAVWFRTSELGDEKDRVLRRSGGDYTYIASDVAYHRDKFERGFDRVINVWGADHHGYINRMKAGIEALGFEPDRLEIIITQLVSVFREGEPVRMSTRAGEFITFREVLEEVGTDATRYFLLAQSPDTAINFDLEVAKRQSMENPVYYLQYAYARMRSLERFAVEQGVERRPLDDVDLGLLVHPAELELLRQADRLGEEVTEAALRRAPHRLVTFGGRFAAAFHRFYTDCRIVEIPEEEGGAELTQARLWLVEAAKGVLGAILGIFGISAPERM